MSFILDENYWNQRYTQQQTGWDIGYPSPPLIRFVENVADKNFRILIPGCGNAYEAFYLYQQGFTNITLLDISPVLTNQLRHKAENLPLRIVTGDFWGHEGTYDLILEQTFFCALTPVKRRAYVQQMHRLLQPQGMLAGVLFNRDFEGGPPFGGNEAIYRSLFEEKFVIKKMELCYNSIPPRSGTELFFIALPRH